VDASEAICDHRGMCNPPIKVLIADDHAVFRMGLAALLQNTDDFHVIAEVDNGCDAIERFLEIKPDLGIFDVRMPVIDGVEAAKQVLKLAPAAKLVMLSTSDLVNEVAQAVRAGARGYLNKRAAPSELLEQLRAAAAGESVISDEVQRVLEDIPSLSPRELDVLHGMAQGKGNKEIAKQLKLSIHTIKTYAKSLLAKLHVDDRAGAVAAGFEQGILKPCPSTWLNGR
jgi:two-component system NarL family response regulator